MRIELKRAEFRQQALETFLLCLFTYEMPLDRVKALLDRVESQALAGFPHLRAAGLRQSFCRELTERLRFVEASIATGEPVDIGTCEECAIEKSPRFEMLGGKRVCKKCRAKHVEAAVDQRDGDSPGAERAPELVLADIARIAFTEAGDTVLALERIRGLLDPEGLATQKAEATS